MLNLLEKVFGDRVSSPQWQATLKAIVPSYGRKLNGDVAATERELREKNFMKIVSLASEVV